MSILTVLWIKMIYHLTNFFENYKLKILSKNKEYNDLKSKKRKIFKNFEKI